MGGQETGAVVENLSNRKLFILLGVLTIVQIGFFLVGGIAAPQPTATMPALATRCRDTRPGSRRWVWLRPFSARNCVDLGQGVLESPTAKIADEIVFVAQMPGPRDNIELEYSPWFQWIMMVMMPTIAWDPQMKWKIGKNPMLQLDIRLGYRYPSDPPDAWKELVSTTVTRSLDCVVGPDTNISRQYDCEPIELFELGSSDYPYYLINIRLPLADNSQYNKDIGRWTDLDIVSIHQNGGYTMVWLTLKTVLTPVNLIALVWFWKRILQLRRKPLLLEKVLMTLGVTMTFLNLPLEWLSLWVRMPFMLLLSDIRQGIFYAVLASFWIIFAGEHLLDNAKRNSLWAYAKHLAAVALGSLCLFVFDVCQRGVQLKDPFYSIWSSKLGANLAYGFVVVAGICAVLYVIFLLYMVGRVWLTIRQRQGTIEHMNRSRKLTYMGIIYRFKFLMLLTAVCAILSVAGFIMDRVAENDLHTDFEDAPTLQYTSAFYTGVYGMWNIYVFLLLSLYAPSHKRYADVGGGAETEPLEGSQSSAGAASSSLGNQVEMSALTVLVKPATD